LRRCCLPAASNRLFPCRLPPSGEGPFASNGLVFPRNPIGYSPHRTPLTTEGLTIHWASDSEARAAEGERYTSELGGGPDEPVYQRALYRRADVLPSKGRVADNHKRYIYAVGGNMNERQG
jgi:hypothetical protein